MIDEGKYMDKDGFIKKLNEEGILIYGTTWESNFKRLQELKKYKEMWGELKYNYGLVLTNNISNYNSIQNNLTIYLQDTMKKLEQKYFPKLHIIKLLEELDKEVNQLLGELGV